MTHADEMKVSVSCAESVSPKVTVMVASVVAVRVGSQFVQSASFFTDSSFVAHCCFDSRLVTYAIYLESDSAFLDSRQISVSGRLSREGFHFKGDGDIDSLVEGGDWVD